MMEDVSFEDLVMMYQDSVVIHKDKPVYVQKIDKDKTIHFVDLNNQRLKSVKFADGEFLPPSKRLGMVNVNNSVVYASRLPVRRYHIGLCTENFQVKPVESVTYPLGRAETVAKVRRLVTPELADALFSIYPLLPEAYDRAVESKGAWAFDKQFAVNAKGEIIYKLKKVGQVKKNPKANTDVRFDAGFEHLETLLEKSYG